MAPPSSLPQPTPSPHYSPLYFNSNLYALSLLLSLTTSSTPTSLYQRYHPNHPQPVLTNQPYLPSSSPALTPFFTILYHSTPRPALPLLPLLQPLPSIRFLLLLVVPSTVASSTRPIENLSHIFWVYKYNQWRFLVEEIHSKRHINRVLVS